MAVITTEQADAAYDYIIVGGGSAGCVLANRLSEDETASILLVESGPLGLADPRINNIAAWFTLLGSDLDWGHVYTPSPATLNRTIPIPRGRVLGGSSAINAMLWYRGHPSDYDEWENLGATGWNFANLLPYFKRCENWQAGPDAWRGIAGPMQITHPPNPHPIALALLQAAHQYGFPIIADYNGATSEGASLSQFNIDSGKRCSAAEAYLRPVLLRPNLSVLTNCTVSQLLFTKTRCTAIQHAGGTILANTAIILCAGAIATPALLMQSGIGPADQLRNIPVPTIINLPGVGQNLQDHPLLMGADFHARQPLGPLRDNGGGSILNWRSTASLPGPDLHAFMLQGPRADAETAQRYNVTAHCFAISPGLMRPRSRGYLRCHGPAPKHLEIQPNFLAEEQDVDTLLIALQTCLDLAAQPAFRDWSSGPASPPAHLSRAEYRSYIRQTCATFFHTAGTCRMGNDENAVTTPQLAVRGTEALYIADASIMPTLPSCNTLAPVIAIAERASDMLRNIQTPGGPNA